MKTIIPYNDQYIEQLVPIMFDLGYPTTSEALLSRIRHIHDQPNNFTFILLYNQNVVGMIGLKMYHYYEDDRKTGQIALLVVKKEYQNKGFGVDLLAFAEAFFKQHNIDHITLQSGIKREREHAHYFYEKNGFKKTGYRFVKNISQ